MIDINSIRITENDPTRIVEGKVIYPQLLSPGIHKIPLENLEQKLLIPFDEKRTRSYLCNRLRELIQELESYNIEMIIWLDGSLCSIKPHPNDIDIVLFLNEEQLAKITENEYESLLNLLENRDLIRARYGCDLFFEKMSDQKQIHYWRSLFSYNQLQEVKGFIQLRVNAHEHKYS